MPRSKPQAWTPYEISGAEARSLSPDDRSLLKRWLQGRRISVAEVTTTRDERYAVRWACWCAMRAHALAEATEDDALDFAAQFSAWRWSPETQKHFVSTMHVLYAWLVDHGHVQADPWRRIKTARRIARLPRVLTPEALQAMVQADTRPDWRSLRDRALLLLMWGTGCRVSEALNLDIADIDLGAGCVVVMGKNSRERYLPLLGPVNAAVALYIHKVRPLMAGGSEPRGPLFLGQHGDRMCRTAARDALIRAASRAGIPQHVHPHLLRHSAATQLLNNGADLRVVQEFLGHVDIGSTQIYTHVARERLTEEVSRRHPLAKG